MPARRSHRRVREILDPGQPQEHGGQEERAVGVRPDEGDDWDQPQEAGISTPFADQEQRQREQHHPHQLRPKRERHRRDHERRERQPRRRAHTHAPPMRRQGHEPERRTHERRPRHGEPRPPADPLHEREQHLRGPLLVVPRLAGDRVGPRVHARDAAPGQHLRAGTQVIGEIGRRQAREHRSEHGQQDGEARPQAAEGHRFRPERSPARRRSLPWPPSFALPVAR